MIRVSTSADGGALHRGLVAADPVFRQGRPGLRQLEDAVARREVNTVVVVALDRLGRSLQHLTALMAEWNALGVQLVSLREAVDTDTPTGRAVMQMSGIFAELESSWISERVKAGMRRAQRDGKKLGNRPLPRHKLVALEGLIRKGEPTAVICQRLHISPSSVTRTRRRMRDAGAHP